MKDTIIPETQAHLNAAALVEGPETNAESRFSWWYRLAAPDDPGMTNNLKQRERYRRGKMISIALFAQILLIVILLPTVGAFVNHALIPNLAIMLIVLTIAVVCNKKGQVVIAGILVVAGLDLSLMGDVASYGQMSTFLLPMLDLLVLPELFAVSLLPAWAVFIDAGIHVIFIVGSLTVLFPKSADLTAILSTSAFTDALARPVALQALVALIAFLWVKSASTAIARAMKATTIAELLRTIAESRRLASQQKEQMEQSVEMIKKVHARVANGDWGARVPLAEENSLIEIAVPLNMLLTRAQKFQQSDRALHYFLSILAQYPATPIRWTPTGTQVDTLVSWYNNTVCKKEGKRV